jgi:hypothetical protein
MISLIFCLVIRKKKNQRKQPQFGCTKGEIFTSPDFDEPVEDTKEYMQ